MYNKNMENKITWKEWNPGLSNGRKALQTIRNTLPGDEPNQINFLVKLFENPKSPIAFSGAINLERHDCVHIMLGRGLLPQDEAFVIGYTMGTSPDISSFESWAFKIISEYIYPEPYNLTKEDLIAYDLGIATGKASGGTAIYNFPFEDHYTKTIASLRKQLNIDIHKLKDVYQAEKALLPGTSVSNRLPR